jgi:hypothetical protein
MGKRIVKQDAKGLYITDNKMKFRPPAPPVKVDGSPLTEGDPVIMGWVGSHYIKQQANGQVIPPPSVHAGYRTNVQATEHAPLQTPHSYGYWISTDPMPKPKPRAPLLTPRRVKKKNDDGSTQYNIAIPNSHFPHSPIKVATSKSDVKYGSNSATDRHVYLNAKHLLTWDEWDQLVETVEEARALCITEILRSDLEAEDMLQEYLTKKGLADGEAPEQETE